MSSQRFLYLCAPLAFVLCACEVPIGLYGHKPVELWTLKAATPADPGQAHYKGDPIVLKRFDNSSLVPVGAHFVGEEPGFETMSQSYAPAMDLVPYMFEATYASLRKAGYPIWKDYVPSAEVRTGPPGASNYTVVHGVVKELELDTFEVPQLDEGARVVMAVTVYTPQGNSKRTFDVASAVRIKRGSGDVLEALGKKVAGEMAKAFEAGL